jgi:uncharacterized membrane protein YebE (DUF533 family)
MFRKILATAATCLIAGQALAGTPVLHQREARQQARIAQGVRSGELTVPEARRLERGQVHLYRMEGAARADGVVTPHERARLERAADVQSRRIYVQKHDAQTRY